MIAVDIFPARVKHLPARQDPGGVVVLVVAGEGPQAAAIRIAAIKDGHLRGVTVDAALAAPHKEFEDTLQYQCAVRNDIPTLITRNTGDFPKDRITVVNPTDYLDMVAREKDG